MLIGCWSIIPVAFNAAGASAPPKRAGAAQLAGLRRGGGGAWRGRGAGGAARHGADGAAAAPRAHRHGQLPRQLRRPCHEETRGKRRSEDGCQHGE